MPSFIDEPAPTGFTQPGGTGPTRVSAIVPALPALPPALKLNCNEALPQLAKVTVAEPTGGEVRAGRFGWSNRPPDVTRRVRGTVRMPGLEVLCAVNQRWPATPAACALFGWVYQVRNKA